MISACCWALTLDPPDGQNPVLDIGGSQQKGAKSVFQGGGSQITCGGYESWGGELRSVGILPNLTPVCQQQTRVRIVSSAVECVHKDSPTSLKKGFIILIIILFVQKPKMQQCKLKTWTLNKTHQAQTSSYGGLWEKEYGNTQIHKILYKKIRYIS